MHKALPLKHSWSTKLCINPDVANPECLQAPQWKYLTNKKMETGMVCLDPAVPGYDIQRWKWEGSVPLCPPTCSPPSLFPQLLSDAHCLPGSQNWNVRLNERQEHSQHPAAKGTVQPAEKVEAVNSRWMVPSSLYSWHVSTRCRNRLKSKLMLKVLIPQLLLFS